MAAHGWLSEQAAKFLTVDGFVAAFTASFTMILATEIGDRTFFIAAIMSMRHPRTVIFSGAIGALILMTVISGVFGLTAVALIPKTLVHLLVVGLMFFFGLQLLRTGYTMEAKEGFEELEEVESEQQKKDQEEGTVNGPAVSRTALAVALQAFTLTFVAEWGDRSQLATIALTAANNPLGVMVGGILGHSLCTGFAVVGGRLIAKYVSERTVTLVGGALFIAFGVYALITGF